jgi:glycine/D-amino acid oxidase-like deaminating enzyme
VSGALVADLVCGRPPALDLEPFGVSRFAPTR